MFEWGIAIYDAEIDKAWQGEKSWGETAGQLGRALRKAARQGLKDYVAFPLLSGPAFLPVLLGNLTANVTRNVWAHTIITCGHFPAGTHTFTEEEIAEESRGEWYLRQLLGSANISGPAVLHLLSGNLSHQIETTSSPTCPATATCRSRRGSATCASASVYPTPPGRCPGRPRASGDGSPAWRCPP